MAITGGQRARYVRDSVWFAVIDGLNRLGWMDAGRFHQPLVFNHALDEGDTEVPLNTVALADLDVSEESAEMGSQEARRTRIMYVDFYAESQVIGQHFANDVADLLAGRMATVGYDSPTIALYDWSTATTGTLELLTASQVNIANLTIPSEQIGWLDIEDVFIDRSSDSSVAHRKYWYAVRFDVIDQYGSDT